MKKLIVGLFLLCLLMLTLPALAQDITDTPTPSATADGLSTLLTVDATQDANGGVDVYINVEQPDAVINDVTENVDPPAPVQVVTTGLDANLVYVGFVVFAIVMVFLFRSTLRPMIEKLADSSPRWMVEAGMGVTDRAIIEAEEYAETTEGRADDEAVADLHEEFEDFKLDYYQRRRHADCWLTSGWQSAVSW